MPLIYTFNQISTMTIFNWVDFTTFTDFQSLIITIGFNCLYYIFLIFFCSIVYKTLLKLWNIIF